jgi:hypothetical protein
VKSIARIGPFSKVMSRAIFCFDKIFVHNGQSNYSIVGWSRNYLGKAKCLEIPKLFPILRYLPPKFEICGKNYFAKIKTTKYSESNQSLVNT